MRTTTLAVSIAVLVTLSACGSGGSDTSATGAASSLPRGSEPVHLDPADFTTEIDNPYFPMAPGSRRVFRETDAEGAVRRVVVTVTNDTKTIMGIEARVVHDIVTEDGQVIEDTYDWYAQDSEGNLWYLGEDTKEYENGKVSSTEGSWEAGVDGAQPGIIIPAHPQPGMTFRAGVLRGAGRGRRRDPQPSTAQADVPYGSFDNVPPRRGDFTPLEPDLVEEKFYATGVGPVLEVTVTGGSDRTELLSVTPGR